MDVFADLAKIMKNDHNSFLFAKVTEWYNKHFVSVDNTTVHRYVPTIASLLVGFMSESGLLTLIEFHGMMRKYETWEKTYAPVFLDLWEEHSEQYNYRVIAEICHKLIYTQASKIPGYIPE